MKNNTKLYYNMASITLKKDWKEIHCTESVNVSPGLPVRQGVQGTAISELGVEGINIYRATSFITEKEE